MQRSLKKVKTGLGFALRAAAAGAFDQRQKQTEEWHNLAQQKPPNYDSKYWDERYVATGSLTHFDWYMDYARLRKVLLPRLQGLDAFRKRQYSSEILCVGSGNSVRFMLIW